MKKREKTAFEAPNYISDGIKDGGRRGEKKSVCTPPHTQIYKCKYSNFLLSNLSVPCSFSSYLHKQSVQKSLFRKK